MTFIGRCTRYFVKIIKYPVLFILVAMLAISFYGFYTSVRPHKIVSQLTPADFNVQYQDVSFYTEDHVKIHGWFIPCAKPHAATIILLHGYPMDSGDILPTRIFLHNDYNLLFFDFRDLGKSGGSYSTIGHEEVLDVRAAIGYLHSRHINTVGVWGLSMGASVAIMAALQMPEIKAVVAQSGFANLFEMAEAHYPIPVLNYPLAELMRLWGILFLHFDIKAVSPKDAAKKLHIPLLILHSPTDNVVAFQQALELKAASANNPNMQYDFTPQAEHGKTSPYYQKLVEKFFKKYLPYQESINRNRPDRNQSYL